MRVRNWPLAMISPFATFDSELIFAVRNFHPCIPHFLDGLRRVIRFQIDSMASIFNHMRFEAELDSVKSGELHAIIGGQARYENVVNIARFQEIAQSSGLPMAIVKKAAVTIYAGIGAFLEDLHDAGSIESWHKRCAWGVLNAMGRPKDLGYSVKVNHIARLFAGVIGGKAAVIRRMPVLGGENQIET